jgi:hypothetical protein
MPQVLAARHTRRAISGVLLLLLFLASFFSSFFLLLYGCQGCKGRGFRK